MNKREELKNAPSFQVLVGISRVMDNRLIDPLIGFFLPGSGDLITGALAVPFIYFALVRLRSLPLTLAILSNVLQDVLLGCIPMFIGDIFDVFSRCHVKNLRLITGYVDNDREIINEMNRKAVWSAIFIAILCVLIYFAVKWAIAFSEYASSG